ncbi:hypothetical protein RRG08_048078 [Elysia crispata]|uniref:Uncharacterized protein n=1 Tax=Elysia crispata TaxID=231223 RepID=A0AAE1B8J7_9GAST|nr:hypothetical protein RRG08_048078 [Elysia crispata]
MVKQEAAQVRRGQRRQLMAEAVSSTGAETTAAAHGEAGVAQVQRHRRQLMHHGRNRGVRQLATVIDQEVPDQFLDRSCGGGGGGGGAAYPSPYTILALTERHHFYISLYARAVSTIDLALMRDTAKCRSGPGDKIVERVTCRPYLYLQNSQVYTIARSTK